MHMLYILYIYIYIIIYIHIYIYIYICIYKKRFWSGPARSLGKGHFLFLGRRFCQLSNDIFMFPVSCGFVKRSAIILAQAEAVEE